MPERAVAELMVVALASSKGTYDAVFVGNYCDNLVDAIKRVKGVGDVKNFTVQDHTMRIWLRPGRLAYLARNGVDSGDPGACSWAWSTRSLIDLVEMLPQDVRPSHVNL